MTINETLEYCVNRLKKANIDEPILKSKLLIINIIEKEKEYLIINGDKLLDDKYTKQIENGIKKLEQGNPIQYITKKQEFMGLEFFINENVLIPQPDTEILVEEVLNITKTIENPKILDLCTGSGAIAIALKKYPRQMRWGGFLDEKKPEITASDISKEALDVAKVNAKNNKAEIKFIEADLFNGIGEKFDIIVSNPPYIKTQLINTLSKEVQNEPHLALDGGQDGLDFYRKIINEAYIHLLDEGYLCLEIGYDQKEEVSSIINLSGNYSNVYSKKDLSGNDRIIVCKKRSK